MRPKNVFLWCVFVGVQWGCEVQRTVTLRALDFFRRHLFGKNFFWNVRNTFACAASNVYVALHVKQTRILKYFSCQKASWVIICLLYEIIYIYSFF